MQPGHDSLQCKSTLTVEGKTYHYYNLKKAYAHLGDLSRLPYSVKVLLENLLRFEEGVSVKVEDLKAIAQWMDHKGLKDSEIAYRPARVLMQDFTGVPAVVDLAAMRDAMMRIAGKADVINPLAPVDLVIDHSVTVESFGTSKAFEQNVALEYAQNRERYEFLRWGQQAFSNFRVVPPGTGICHQVNTEYLARCVWSADVDGETYIYPDTLVGTDSHTTMVNGMGVLGWGVGGIEAEAAMLGQPISMLLPEVIGFKLTGKLREGITATDLVLTVTQMLRQKKVVGKFVEFFGEGMAALALENRCTIANMAPEYGATCGFFPIDHETIQYLKETGRPTAVVEAYAKEQGLWHDESVEPVFTDTLELDLSTVVPSLAGPKRPQDRVTLSEAGTGFKQFVTGEMKKDQSALTAQASVEGKDYKLENGSVVIAAITSCTNTSNPYVMVAAGLVARNAAAKGMTVKPWVKTSLAPGSQVVTDYLEKCDLQKDLDTLGFNLVGYGCTTCIGNSGPLSEEIANSIISNDLVVAAVLSGNRNFEGRVNPHVKANYLASPPLVVAYALAGTMKINLDTDSLGIDRHGQPVYLKDIWPTTAEISQIVRSSITAEMFKDRYANVSEGDLFWQAIQSSKGETYTWKNESTYVQNPPYFHTMPENPSAIAPIHGARVLAIFGDSITTDHISPAGNIKKDGPAGRYLSEKSVPVSEFNSYGARRGNHEVMMRGTFANTRIKNEMLGGKEGGNTLLQPSGEEVSIYDAAMTYQASKTPLVIFAGQEYGTGSSRDWAAKGTTLLGVKAVIAESFERIHRSNLVGMGVVPLTFKEGLNRKALNLKGDEIIDLPEINEALSPRKTVKAIIHYSNGETREVELLCRIDTETELDYYRHGGVMPYVLRGLRQKIKNTKAA
jgi:aconitate hydratase